MKPTKALRLFNALEPLKAVGRDSEDREAPPIETRYAFAVRLNAASSDEGKTRKWSIRVTALHDAADWRKVFEAVREADDRTYGDGEVWPPTKIRIDNSGVELC